MPRSGVARFGRISVSDFLVATASAGYTNRTMLSLPALLELIATAPDGEARARFLHDGARSLLADPRPVVAITVGAASADDASQTEAAAALLSRAHDEARMSVENAIPQRPFHPRFVYGSPRSTLARGLRRRHSPC
jgi:hypothetical protein